MVYKLVTNLISFLTYYDLSYYVYGCLSHICSLVTASLHNVTKEDHQPPATRKMGINTKNNKIFCLFHFSSSLSSPLFTSCTRL